AGSAGTWLGCALVAGGGMRASSLGLAIGEIALTVIALGWFFAVRTRQPAFHDERERWPIPRTYGVGILYALAWMPRVALLSVPLLYAAQQLGIGEVSPALEQILGPTADPWSAGLVFTSAVVLAPIAEEVLFRGLLLPHLGRMLPGVCRADSVARTPRASVRGSTTTHPRRRRSWPTTATTSAGAGQEG